ncbi:S8 family peptidase [Rossellomorea sp. DUT-2]|uniref:S8 family peptidase n=1 Tax=Rossellomorea sp. DUT-2 TaxID=3412021 RepID=UPI003D172072
MAVNRKLRFNYGSLKVPEILFPYNLYLFRIIRNDELDLNLSVKGKLFPMKNILFGFGCIAFLSGIFLFSSLIHKPPIKVAVMDSGLDYTLDVFEGTPIRSKEFPFRLPQNGEGMDENGHGTAIASLLVKNLSEKERKSIILYNIKVLDESGRGDPVQLHKGIEWAIKQDVDLINISSGFQKYDSRVDEVIQKAINHNIIIVASAGNNLGMESDYPARFNGVLSVSAIKENLDRLILSSTGKVDFVAIGENVEVSNIDSSVSAESGSSIAAAKVSSIILLEMLQNHEMIKDPEKVKEHLERIAIDLGENGKDRIFGSGYIKTSGG